MSLDVYTPDEWLASLPKPPMIRAGHLVISPKDWLVLCAGFEDRAVHAIQTAASKTTPFNVLLVHYLPFFAENKSEHIREVCERVGIKVFEVTYDRQAPAGFAATLLEELS